MRRTLLLVVPVAALLLAGCSAASSAEHASHVPPPAAGRPGAAGANAAGKAGEAGEPSGTAGFGPVVNAAEDPQSTFALDVDTASYTYARSAIEAGAAPEPSTVRPEEFINSFPGNYPPPEGDGFAVSLDGARLPASHRLNSPDGIRLLRVGLSTRPDPAGQRPDATLTFVIDVSGSMGDPGKLDLVKGALHTLVHQLRRTDAVGIVVFNTQARFLLPVTTVDRAQQVDHAIDQLAAGGGTDLGAGLVAGYQEAREHFRAGTTNRVVLLSDGLANHGDTEASQILAQVKENAAKQISLLGVGVGRDYGDALMEQLADHGDGFVVYISDAARAAGILTDTVPATRALRALDAKAQVTFEPRTVQSYRLIGYDDRALADSSFRNDHVDGGEVAAGYSVTALYLLRLQPDASGLVATADVRWQDPRTRQAAEASDRITVADLDVPFTATAPRLRVAYAAGYFAEVLRESPYGPEVRLPDLAAIVRDAGADDDDQAVADLARVIDQAARHR